MFSCGHQVRGWSTEASDEMRSLLGSEAVEMQVFGDESGTLQVDLKRAPMVSLREHLVFMEMARSVMARIMNLENFLVNVIQVCY